MAIHTYQSFSGYLSTEPVTEPTRNGVSRFYARAGQRQGRREEDGNFTRLPTQYMPIVAFGEAAEEAAALLSKGDKFIAEGRIRQVSYVKDGQRIEGEEFEVWKIGRRRTGTDQSAQPVPAARAEAPAHTAQQHTREIPAEFTAAPAPGHSATAPAL